MKEAKFYQSYRDNRIQCTLCPRNCILKEGQHGFCYVRQNINGKLVLTAYGHPLALNVDPIEKKPLYHFMPGSQIISIGTAGCNLACKFCQNCELSHVKEDHRNAANIPPDKVIQLALKNNTRCIAYTYNEPTVFAEYAMDTAELGRQHNLKNVMVTNGYINPEWLETVYENIDAANVDLKAFSNKFYNSVTLSKLEPVLEALKILKQLGVWLEITNLIIPNLNDLPEEITKMCEWIVKELGENIPLHFSAFHPAFKLTSQPATPASTLLMARQIAFDTGLRYVYIGNVHHKDASSTYCHNCKTKLIDRNGFYSRTLNLEDGKCRTCHEKIPGIF